MKKTILFSLLLIGSSGCGGNWAAALGAIGESLTESSRPRPASSGADAAPSTTEQFCSGFEEGYRSVKGSRVMVPICPVPPVTPVGSTPFREGIKAGIRRAGEGRQESSPPES